jgi:putative DNA primase/helicase
MENNQVSSPNFFHKGQVKDNNLNPQFDNSLLEPDTIISDLRRLVNKEKSTPHSDILDQLLNQFDELDFQALAFPQVEQLRAELANLNANSDRAKVINKELESYKLNERHYLILSVQNIIQVAEKNRWGLCKNQEFIYLFNGEYWVDIDIEVFQMFLGEAAEKMGVGKFTARYYQFREKLLNQFLATEHLPTPEPPENAVYINLKNGTLEVTENGAKLRPFNSADFLTYSLPFDYNPKAQAPIFQAYLDRVLPDKEKQNVLAEFLGFVFIRNGSHTLKEEKALVAYGTGANGKSVLFLVVNALFGKENTSSYSLQNLTDTNGYYRAMIANKLVNYASEISTSLETTIFKQLASGEPVEARLPYGKPMQIRQYAKMIFNCNELPKDVEHTHAYFRRLLIIPFDVTIPEGEQDKQLHAKIIESELSGVLNWALNGLYRLLQQQSFSPCSAAIEAVENYKTQSDSVKLFLEESGYKKSPSTYKLIKELYAEYRIFCNDDGFKPVNKVNFKKRLENIGIRTEKNMYGNVAYLSKQNEPF